MSPGNRKFVLQVCKSVSVWKIDWTAPLVCLCLSSPGSPLTSPITVIAQPDPPTSQWPVLTGPWNPKADQSVQLSPTLFNPMDCSTPGFPVHHQLLELAHTHSHWVNDVIQPSHPLSSVFPSIRIFSSESVLCIRWPKYWSFSFSINPSNEYSGLISFRIDWLDLLVIQGTLKSLLQHHSSKASVLQWSAFFVIQLSHPYMTSGKTIALTRQTFVGTVMSLLFDMLSGFVIAFFPKEHASFDFMAASTICSDFGAQENKSLS